MAERLAIVGGDAAGMSAASTARRRQPALDVVAFERGPYTSFSACGIPFYVGGLFDDSDRLVTRSPDEHRGRGIEVHTRTTVTAIDLDRRELTVRDQSGDERREAFDQLVLATGAEAVAPDVPGAETAEPARTIDASARRSRRAATTRS
jgi:NADPH-dependent 2,4-dienoyl-CoA reductase/sulfur reductase-like enzyme